MEVGRVRAIWAGWAGGWVDWTALNPRQPHKKKKKTTTGKQKKRNVSHNERSAAWRGGLHGKLGSVASGTASSVAWHGGQCGEISMAVKENREG